MAIDKKKVKPGAPNLVQLRSTRTTSEGRTVTTVETWIGPYKDLETKQNASLASKTTHLEPTQAGEGRLTITREAKLPENQYNYDSDSEVFTEVIWQELSKPVETHPHFQEIAAADVAKIRAAAEAGEPGPAVEQAEIDLYNLFSRGTTEWVTGVPVVRRTTTKVRGDLAAGRAWVREDPPVKVEGSWEWMKTADERRRDGESYTQTEEWQGAEEWDPVLYPSTPSA